MGYSKSGWGSGRRFSIQGRRGIKHILYYSNMFVSINMHAAEDAVPLTNISILEFQVASTFRTCTLRVPPAMWLWGISHFYPFYRWECPMFFHSPLALGLDRVVFFPFMAPQKIIEVGLMVLEKSGRTASSFIGGRWSEWKIGRKPMGFWCCLRLAVSVGFLSEQPAIGSTIWAEFPNLDIQRNVSSCSLITFPQNQGANMWYGALHQDPVARSTSIMNAFLCLASREGTVGSSWKLLPPLCQRNNKLI